MGYRAKMKRKMRHTACIVAVLFLCCTTLPAKEAGGQSSSEEDSGRDSLSQVLAPMASGVFLLLGVLVGIKAWKSKKEKAKKADWRDEALPSEVLRSSIREPSKPHAELPMVSGESSTPKGPKPPQVQLASNEELMRRPRLERSERQRAKEQRQPLPQKHRTAPVLKE